MMAIYIEPQSIRLHYAEMQVLGGSPPFVPLLIVPPELVASFHATGGVRGDVSVPLTSEETAALQTIIDAATRRALDLIKATLVVAP